MTTGQNVFVTGITGNQGHAVANHLLKKGVSVIGLTRNANSKKALQLKEHGVTIIEGDLNNPQSYASELNSADSIFLVQALQKQQNEIDQGKVFIDAIDTSRNPHLVYASVLGADLNTGVPHFESKNELEAYIKSKDLNYTILRPASFYENHLMPQVAKGIYKGKYISPLKSNCVQQMIGVNDIGKIASQVITNKSAYDAKTLSLATDEYEIGDMAKAFSESLNIPVKYGKLPGLITRLAMGKDLYKMFKYMNKNNFRVVDNISDLRSEFNIEGDFKSWISDNFKT